MAKRKAAAPKEDDSQSEAPAKAPADSVYIGKSVKPEVLNPSSSPTARADRRRHRDRQDGDPAELAEGFPRGVPVFCADVKGDLSGIARAGEPKGSRSARQGDRLPTRPPR